MEKLYYTIKEVAAMIGVSESTLRYWETEFVQLRPSRTPGGRRRYTTEDIEKVKQIVYLLADQKMHVDGAKHRLQSRPDEIARKQQIAESLKNIKQELVEIKRFL
ncbi:MAG: MerR family transcriptional regulator [Paludibacteraceae bacterium]|nr:MerR family transcriptional regulator [Paludibacteraceae bacterium]MBO7234924.1 MerR family transcriptional regulator [Paludibacteraceae bacterium]MBO7258505.1 MerR family transcriptional regulator [Paludibacteraceae bacterium]